MWFGGDIVRSSGVWIDRMNNGGLDPVHWWVTPPPHMEESLCMLVVYVHRCVSCCTQCGIWSYVYVWGGEGLVGV